jgi:hypothetical protein
MDQGGNFFWDSPAPASFVTMDGTGSDFVSLDEALDMHVFWRGVLGRQSRATSPLAAALHSDY